VAALPEIQQRKMFGYPAAFVNGHMFAGVFQASVGMLSG
jgi:TfoX/Sxy family transcriptional regulator of competence genes